LLQALVFEGLAQHYEAEERGTLPIYARPTSDLQTLWNQAQAAVSGPYDHQAWFFGSESQGLPRWGGYALGYELVRRFFQQHGGDAVIHAITAADLFYSAWEADGQTGQKS
jgi:uncharacterized protein YjaZ